MRPFAFDDLSLSPFLHCHTISQTRTEKNTLKATHSLTRTHVVHPFPVRFLVCLPFLPSVCLYPSQQVQEPVAAMIQKKKVGLDWACPQEASKQYHLAGFDLNPRRKSLGHVEKKNQQKNTEAEMRKGGHYWRDLEKTALNRVDWRSGVHGLCSSWLCTNQCRVVSLP